MIISHEHEYSFFAIPRTGSQALSAHLINNYKGERLGQMHCSYEEFQMNTNRQFNSYYSFTIIRNPLDSVVSSYFKKKTDHNGRFSRGSFKNGKPIGPKSMEEYNFITKNDSSFSEYFIHFFEDNVSWPRHTRTLNSVDKVMHFENLDDDFKELCSELNLNYSPIPKLNMTGYRSKDWWEYYDDKARTVALKSFANIMKEWGYEFPITW